MNPRETENKIWGDKQRKLWYVMVFSGVVRVAKQVERFHLMPVFPYL